MNRRLLHERIDEEFIVRLAKKDVHPIEIKLVTELRDALADAHKALGAAKGYLLNTIIDLETGCPKATAATTARGGVKMVDEALAKYEDAP